MWHRLVTALALTGLIAGFPLNIEAQTYKIWPLGNSITEGEGSTAFNGYRKPLYNKLKDYVNQQNEGVDINFVGTRSNGDFVDPQHDGWAGQKTSFIRSNAQSWLNSLTAQGEIPDFVLFHIGTNDISAKRGVQFIIEDIDATLDIIWNNGVNIKIFLCGIIPRLDSLANKVSPLNSEIWSLVDRRRNQEGKAIYYVDQYNEFINHNNWENDYMVNNGTDNLHPNNTGYDAMANRFKGVVTQHLVPGTTPVELVTFSGFARDFSIDLTWRTATESNNLGFYVEHSFADGPFTDVDFLEGHGTTVEEHVYTFEFATTQSGLHKFRLRQVDNDGTINYSPEITVVVQPPNRIALHQNYPNPFRPGFSISNGTKIPFELQNSARVTINIYNISGQLVKSLSSQSFDAGLHELNWDGRNNHGLQASSGIYFVKLQSGAGIVSKSLQLIR